MSFDNIGIRQIVQVALSNHAIIVDVREPERFRESHIPMAINLPYSQIEKGNVNLPRSRTLIVYCETGVTSLLAARILSNLGYRVINCVGGLKNYNASLTK